MCFVTVEDYYGLRIGRERVKSRFEIPKKEETKKVMSKTEDD